MEVVDRIHNCKDDEQLYWLTKRLIKEAYNRTKQYNKYKGLIGIKSEVNKREFDYDPSDDKDSYFFSVPFWNGYIPLNTKIVYGNICSKYYESNCGCYYYVDDDSYVYEFVKQLNGWDVQNCFDLLTIINGFSRELFEKNINAQSRNQIHKLLIKDKDEYFEPIKEHSIKDFYGNGSALCTEYALIACNLLNVLGVPTYYCMDKYHAFNMFFDKIEGTEDDYNGYLLDYSDGVAVYDESYNTVGKLPFYLKIETKKSKFIILPEGEYLEIKCKKDLDEIKEKGNYILLPNGDYVELDNDEEKSNIDEFNEFFDKVVNEEKRIITRDFCVETINNRMFKIPIRGERNYGIDCRNENDEVKILKKRKENR